MGKEVWSKEEFFEYAKSMFDPSKTWEKPELLKGVRVLEFAVFMNGPLVTSFLAELGAEVIKFELPPGARAELPPGGDTSRYLGPPDVELQGNKLLPFIVSRNKYHVTLDIAHPKGKELFRQLAIRPDTDVIVENLRAGGMDELGLGYRHLSEDNPRLIYLSTNGPGQWGPNAEMVSYDLVAQAMAGFAYVTGFPENDPHYPGIPTMCGNAIGDSVGAIWGYTAVLAALYYRERSGKGQFIEFSQIDGLLRILDVALEWYSLTGNIRERTGNRHSMAAPYCISKCKDGYIILGCGSNKMFASLCKAMGRPELAKDPKYAIPDARTINQMELYEIVDAWLLKHTKEELRKIADEYSFVFAPVLNAKEIAEHPHLRERGAVVDFEDPIYGKMTISTLPTHFSETPARVYHLLKPIGHDNEYIYGKYFGFSKSDIEQLRQEKVI